MADARAVRALAESRLTPKLQAALLDHLRTGMPIRFACGRVGIHHDTYYQWLDKAADAKALVQEGREITALQRRYIVFAHEAVIARNHGGGWLYEQLLNAPANMWQKYSAAMERQFHDVWSTRYGTQTMTVDKKNGVVEVKLAFDIDEQAAEQLRER